MSTATIDLPDVSQPFEWRSGGMGIKVRPSVLSGGLVRIVAWDQDSGVLIFPTTDDARKLAAYIWAAAAEADARADA